MLPEPSEDNKIEIEIEESESENRIIDFGSLNNDNDVKIEIPENNQTKIKIALPNGSELPQIEAKKGNVSLVIPKGVKVEEGSDASALELISDKDINDNIKAKFDAIIPEGKKLDEVFQVFTMGGSEKVEFSEYITLTFIGMAGKDAAYIQNDDLYYIQKFSDDSKGLESGLGEYAFELGNDLIVKTNRFADYISYTASEKGSNPGGGGGVITPQYITFINR